MGKKTVTMMQGVLERVRLGDQEQLVCSIAITFILEIKSFDLEYTV